MPSEKTDSGGERIRLLLATCFGLGYSPILPGTCGALIGLASYLVTAWLVPTDPWLTIILGAMLLVWIFITVWLGGWAEKYFQEKDSGIFVSDEVVGFLMTVTLFHLAGRPGLTALWAFPLTRIIDILKFPPARRLEELPKGWGVVADDLLSSLYTVALLYGLLYTFPQWFPG